MPYNLRALETVMQGLNKLVALAAVGSLPGQLRIHVLFLRTEVSPAIHKSVFGSNQRRSH